CRDDEVLAPFLDLFGAKCDGTLAVDFIRWHKLEKVAGDIEHATGRSVFEWDAHAAFAGDQADVADREIADILWIETQIRADAASGPVAKQLQFRPAVFRVEGTGAPHDSFQVARAALIRLANAAGQRLANVGGYSDAIGQGAVVYVADQAFFLVVAHAREAD